MKILVTGGAGFIGSHVVDAYLAAGHTVAVLDNLSSGKKENIPAGVRLFEADITDAEAVKVVFEEFQPDVVNHHAAQISVSVSVREPRMDAERNILGTINLLEATAALPVAPRFIYATSGGAMYGNPEELPLVETSTARPISPYGLSKYVAEQYVWMYSTLKGISVVVLRYSNVYGPRQDPHGEAGVCAIYTDAMLADQPVKIFGDGSQQRDYVFVGDVARASVAALEKGTGQSYNIATGVATSTREVYTTLKEATAYTRDPEMLPGRPGDLQVSILSNQKAARELGWVPTRSFKEGIEETVAWARKR